MLQMASLNSALGKFLYASLYLGKSFTYKTVWTRLVGASLLPGGGGNQL